MGQCILCSKQERDGKDEFICSLCIQRLLRASDEAKTNLRDKLLEKERPEAARMVESFIEGEAYGDTRKGQGERRNRQLDSGRRPLRTLTYQKRQSRSPQTKQRVSLYKHISTGANLSRI